MRREFTILIIAVLFALVAAICHGSERKKYIEQRTINTHIAIFVHGFTGDYLATWGKFPNLLQADSSLDQFDFLFWGYPSKLFRPSETIRTIGEHLKTEIKFLPKSYKRIVLIGHSMGGLVIRSFVVQALIDGKGAELNHISEVILFGTPNDGLRKASFVPRLLSIH